MGICLSCLGSDRPSSDNGDLDRILDSQQPSYGTQSRLGSTLPDEVELQREREVLEVIAARAGENMIDVRNPFQFDQSEICLAIDSSAGGRSVDAVETRPQTSEPRIDDFDGESDESSWLGYVKSVPSNPAPLPQKGSLVMDLSLLRGNAV